ncbi:hypothetical protein TRFO_22172 [Tritrichomonas foetus]|uniref:Armadillo repeat-containing domain-containing protein n=1 Tax=Tritrichomonas foetus TaxID=1144522 RepID=A0A1J4KDN6_9EUKA|nr:hypothetical protein TRFO_22172 [Tritrichomonas foetus]|eukprot:OHT09024.1 hypothetical protein TRFO_22172 [Tritrichomonas foetus]
MKPVVGPEKAKRLPKILHPDRPVTPRTDQRIIPSDKQKRIRNIDVHATKSQLGAVQKSKFKQLENFPSQSTDEAALTAASADFENICTEFHRSKNLTTADLSSYQAIYPLMQQTIEKGSNSTTMIHFLHGYLHLRLAFLSMPGSLNPMTPVKKITEPSTPPRSIRKTSKYASSKQPKPTAVQSSVKLDPIDSSQTQKQANNTTKTVVSEKLEHFNRCISLICYKLSIDQSNDVVFQDVELSELLISLVSDESHTNSVRVYAAAALKNASHSLDFRRILLSMNKETFIQINNVYQNSITEKSLKLLTITTGFLRSLVVDKRFIEFLVNDVKVNVSLIQSIDKINYIPKADKFDPSDFVFMCFRVLTKLCEKNNAKQDIINTFKIEKFLSIMFTTISRNISTPHIIMRVCYVLSLFPLSDEKFTTSAKKKSSSKTGNNANFIGCEVFNDCLNNEYISKNDEAVEMILHVIANFAVDKDLCEIFIQNKKILNFFQNRTFKEDDKVGYNLLAVVSNFTFYDSNWINDTLLNNIPVAIISNRVESIVETLRILINLTANKDNSDKILLTPIPDLLVVLLDHSCVDIVVLALQCTVNLISNDKMKDVFMKMEGVDKIIDILSGDEVDSEALEALSKLLIVFDWLDQERAKIVYDKFNEFEYDHSNEIYQDLVHELKKKF